MVQPMAIAFIRCRLWGDALFRWATDQRKLAIGISWFTRSYVERSVSTVSFFGQWIVTGSPRWAAHFTIWYKLSFSPAVGLLFLFISQVIRSPNPFDFNIPSPKPSSR